MLSYEGISDLHSVRIKLRKPSRNLVSRKPTYSWQIYSVTEFDGIGTEFLRFYGQASDLQTVLNYNTAFVIWLFLGTEYLGSRGLEAALEEPTETKKKPG